jgi:hypothetical protein
MDKPKTTVEILKYLDKSNCKECGYPACMAFALAVYREEKTLWDCPRMDPEVARQFGGDAPRKTEASPEPEEALADLQKQIPSVDLSAAAERTGGRYAGGRLTVKILGKDFSVGMGGELSSDIHINPWVAGPFLKYVITSKGIPPTGKWVPMRELEKGKDWDRFFTQRCEKPIKKVADTYTDFFKDLVELFNGRPVENHYESDISLVLHPLPLVPVLICYWAPEDGLPSTLNIFFDANVEKNLPTESVFTLGSGLATMFEKLTLRHCLFTTDR